MFSILKSALDKAIVAPLAPIILLLLTSRSLNLWTNLNLHIALVESISVRSNSDMTERVPLLMNE